MRGGKVELVLEAALLDLVRRYDSAEREACTQGLGEGEDIGDDAVVLKVEVIYRAC